MKKKSLLQSAFTIRSLCAAVLCCASVLLILFAFGYRSQNWLATGEDEEPARFLPTGGKHENEGQDLLRLEQYWHNLRSYPTGRFNPAWVRRAADQHRRLAVGIPQGVRRSAADLARSPLALNPNSFTALGPAPEKMTGCSGCFDYTTTEGRANALAVDPTTT